MRAWLTIELGEGSPRSCELPTDRPFKIGRYRENSLILRGEHVSRFHAEIYCEAERWFIRDCGTTNGTRLDGERIQQPTELSDGREIGLGGTRLRIHLNCAPPIQIEPVNPPAPMPCPASASDSATVLRADELSVLCSFMSLSVAEQSFEKLLRLALETARHQTGATLAGFLSLDAENPVPKLVVPEMSA